MLQSNTTLIAVTTKTGTRAEASTGVKFVLSPAPKNHVDDATHCLYLPLPLDEIDPDVGGTIELTPDGGFTQTFDVLQVDQVPGGLPHCAVWLKAQT